MQTVSAHLFGTLARAPWPPIILHDAFVSISNLRGSLPSSNALPCSSSRQLADDDYCDPCLLVPFGRRFRASPSYRGRLCYLPGDSKSNENISGCFRNRGVRPSLLCITSVAAERSPSRYAVSVDHIPSYTVGKLARSREQAKRFFRLSFSPEYHTSSAAGPSPPASGTCRKE